MGRDGDADQRRACLDDCRGQSGSRDRQTGAPPQRQITMNNSGGFSVVIIAKNEAQNIARCLRSITRSDDVVVVDDNSTDETAQIAESLGARVVNHPFASFAAQRNWAIENAGLRHTWVLMLDADEALTSGVENAIVAAVEAASGDVAGFLLCRKTMFLRRAYAEWRADILAGDPCGLRTSGSSLIHRIRPRRSSRPAWPDVACWRNSSAR